MFFLFLPGPSTIYGENESRRQRLFSFLKVIIKLMSFPLLFLANLVEVLSLFGPNLIHLSPKTLHIHHFLPALSSPLSPQVPHSLDHIRLMSLTFNLFPPSFNFTLNNTFIYSLPFTGLLYKSTMILCIPSFVYLSLSLLLLTSLLCSAICKSCQKLLPCCISSSLKMVWSLPL